MTPEHRFFLITAILFALTNVAAFSLQHAMGRSSFVGSPIYVHVHAVTFFGWTFFYLLQNALATTGSVALHKRLGWLGAAWIPWMVAVGIFTTVMMVRSGRAPFFFQPGYFLTMNAIGVLAFAGLSTGAILLRKRTDWHRRLHYCGMAMIMGPAFGRLLPVPFMVPWVGLGVFAALMIFPILGVAFDLRRDGRVHPAWRYGIGTMVGAQLLIEMIGPMGLGGLLYHLATLGSPGASIAPYVYPPFPPLP